MDILTHSVFNEQKLICSDGKIGKLKGKHGMPRLVNVGRMLIQYSLFKSIQPGLPYINRISTNKEKINSRAIQLCIKVMHCFPADADCRKF